MKSFVHAIASSDERILMVARLHWIYPFAGLVWFAAFSWAGIEAEAFLTDRFGAVSQIPADFIFFQSTTSLAPVRWFFILAGFTAFATLALQYVSTEVALTDRRFVYKTGLFMIEVSEVGIDDIRGEHVHHGVFGGIVGYGGLRIECRYVDSIDVPAIGNPHRFIRAIHALRAARESSGPPVTHRPEDVLPTQNMAKTVARAR